MPQLAPADSLAADSVAQAAADSLERAREDSILAADSTALGQVRREITETGRLIAEGRFDEVAERATDLLVGFALSQLLPALIVAIVFWVLYRFAAPAVVAPLRRSHRVNQGVEQLFERVVRLTIGAIGLVIVLDQVGINVAALVAGLGIAGIALGFAARDTMENLIAGVTILLDQPFVVGDNVELEDTFGTVHEITLRSTRLRTLDHQMAVFPNTQMIAQKVLNHTRLGTLGAGALRVRVPFGIAYKEFPQEVRGVVIALTDGDKRLHPDYPPTVVVTEMNASSVDMELRLHLRDPKLEVPVRFEYLEKVREALRAADIEVPFPHLQLFIDEAKAFENTHLMAPPKPPPSAPRAEA
jgi:small conductance mechanosensitive channel